MSEKDIRQAVEQAERQFIDRMVDVFRRAMTEAYQKGLVDGARLAEPSESEAERRLAEEAEGLAQQCRDCQHWQDGDEGPQCEHPDCPPCTDDEPLVRLKPGAILRRRIKEEDFVGCRNKTRIWNQMKVCGIKTLGDLARLTEADVLRWRNFGRGSYTELCQVMKMWGVEFKQ